MTKRNAGTTYAFLVRAYYKDKNGKKIINPYTSANIVKATTLCSAPNVKVTVSQRNVKLFWNKVRGAVYYNVYEYNAANKKYTLLKEKVGSVSYVMKNVNKGTHNYLVRACNATSAASNFTSNNLVRVSVK